MINDKNVKIKIGKSRIDQEYLKTNNKITEYYEGKKCPVCHMMKDVGEEGVCKHCLEVYAGDTDGV